MQGVNWKTTYDQMGCEVTVPRSPRIISLVPSQTELLFDLGLEQQVVGVTKFCIYPSSKVKDRVKVGGTKRFDFDKIKNLNPDLIIGNKEENYKEGIEELKERYPVWMSDIVTFEDALEMIVAIGCLTETENKAIEIRDKIVNGFKCIKKQISKKVLYFIWQKPYMVAGGNTFINEILGKLGLENLANELDRYPELSHKDIESLQPELVLLSSEPYPFKQKHINNVQAIYPDAEVKIVNGEMFSWYGSRLMRAVEYFNQLQL
ncbi:ABC transporter substrate-binding protein [Fulvivirga sp. 29W222]|uniref:ABC transporter substrate-binding protein n=1 Tax=Fulvivirga marina TaxID=2494733 RepID=A0A937FXD1_9BACT|nr:helical backbone metal receptor [Fulvivirga marina]MBL6446472.1 ABC transporter substrate-binding protein [Fulvivirga marina]